VLHMQFLGCSTLNAAMRPKPVFFENKIAPFNIQRIALQHHLFPLRRKQARMMGGSNNKNCGNDNGDKEKAGYFAVAQQIAANYPRQRMRSSSWSGRSIKIPTCPYASARRTKSGKEAI